MDNYQTTYAIVANINGQIKYVNNEELSDLDDDTPVAKVKIISNNGKEVDRDEFVDDDAWMTAKQYFDSHSLTRKLNR